MTTDRRLNWCGISTETVPADPWSISYHQLSPARNNPAVCTCGLGPVALMHNEPPHPFNGRPKPGMPPVTGICTDCHHHETADCHQSAAGARQDETTIGEAAPETTEPRPCRTFVSGGAVWCCEEGEIECPCVCHLPAAGARQDGTTS